MTDKSPSENTQAEEAARVKQILDSKSYVDNPESLPWYQKDVPEIKPKTRDLLKEYSKIDPSDIDTHVKKVVR